jgi:hypothetical protein
MSFDKELDKQGYHFLGFIHDWRHINVNGVYVYLMQADYYRCHNNHEIQVFIEADKTKIYYCPECKIYYI